MPIWSYQIQSLNRTPELPAFNTPCLPFAAARLFWEVAAVIPHL